jgi:plastocyanin
MTGRIKSQGAEKGLVGVGGGRFLGRIGIGKRRKRGGNVMKRLTCLVAVGLLMLSALAPAAWAQGDEVTVGMEDNFFDEAEIAVEPGTTVTWVQRGQYGHTTTSYDGLWDSGLIEGGTDGTFSYTFEDPGTYEYFCEPHEEMGMVGTVTVSGGSASASASASATASASPGASAEAEPLTDTGGPSLALVAALLLVSSSLVSLAVLRRGAS